MAFIPVPHGAEVEIRCTLDTQNVECTLWFEDPAGWSGTSLLGLANNIITWFGSFMTPLLPDSLQLREVFAKDHAVAAGAEATAVEKLPSGRRDDPYCRPEKRWRQQVEGDANPGFHGRLNVFVISDF